MGKILKVVLIVVAIVISVIALQPQYTLTLLGKFVVAAGAAALASELQGTPDFGIAEQKGIRDEITGSVVPRNLLYGTMRGTGTVVYAGTHSTDNKYLTMIFVLGAGEINAFTKWFVGDEEVTLNGSGLVTTGQYANKIRITSHVGTDTQTADTAVSGDISEWTANHRLRGLAYFAVRYEFDTEVFSGRRPVVSAVFQGHKLYNPALDSTIPGGSGTHRHTDETTWTWDGDGNNWGLVALDYLKRSPLGARIPVEWINLPLAISAYNVSNEDVALKAGGTQKRYTIDGLANSAQKRNNILDAMFRASAGRLIYQAGQFNIYPGATAVGIIGLGDDDLREPITIQTARPNKVQVNRVVGTYIDNQSDVYRETDYPDYVDSAATTIDGEPLDLALNQPYLQDGIRAQRVAKIFQQEARQQMSVTYPAKLKGMQLQAWSVVKLSSVRWSFVDKLFRVVSWQRVDSGGVNLQLVEYSDAMYSWNEVTEEQPVVGPDNPTLADGTLISPVVNLAATPVVLTGDQGTAQDGVKVTWDTPDLTVLGTHVQYRKLGDVDYLATSFVRREITFLHIPKLEPNTVYEIRAKHINMRDISGIYSVAIQVTTATGTIVDFDNIGGYNSDSNGWTADDDTFWTADRIGNPLNDATNNITYNQPDEPPSASEGDSWIDNNLFNNVSKKFTDGSFQISSTEGAVIGVNTVDSLDAVQGDAELKNIQQEWDQVQDGSGTIPDNNATLGAIQGLDFFKAGGLTLYGTPEFENILQEWTDIQDTGGFAPADNATVGAPSGSNINGTLAQNLFNTDGEFLRILGTGVQQNQGNDIVRNSTFGLSYNTALDGDAVTFGTAWQNIPTISFLSGGLSHDPTGLDGAKQHIQSFIAQNLTTAGFDAILKIKEIASGIVSETDGEGTGTETAWHKDVGHAGPLWQAGKENAAEAWDGNYTFKYDVTASFSFPNNINTVTAAFYTNDGGGWTKRGTLYHLATVLEQVFTVNVDGLTTNAGGGAEDIEFGMDEESVQGTGTVSDVIDVTWDRATAPSEASATPSGVTAIPYIVLGNNE